jgi:GNAT superfamily N-acetyltransferase
VKSIYHFEVGDHHIAIADVMPLVTGGHYVNRINVPQRFRGKGYGSRLLNMILEDADNERTMLVLEPSASGGLSQEDLIEWYQRHGFVFRSKGVLLRYPAVGNQPSNSVVDR